MKTAFKNGVIVYKRNGVMRTAPPTAKNIKVLQNLGYDLNKILTLNGKLSIPMYPFQFEGVMKAKKQDWNLLIADEMGVGKALVNGTKVFTAHGYLPIETLKVGDKVYGTDGKLHNVTGVYPQGIKPCYAVTFNKYHTVKCSADHLWTVQTWQNRHSHPNVWNTYTTEELIDHKVMLHNKNGDFSHYYLPEIKPLQFEVKRHFISSYLLGVLIAEGSMKHSVTFTNPESSIVESIRAEVVFAGYELHTDDGLTWRITKGETGGRPNAYINEIRRLGLDVNSPERFIPSEYLYDSAENRLQLLQGLMDCDGTTNGNIFEYNTTSKKLRDDVIFLAESLGCVVMQSDRIPYYKDKHGNKVLCKKDWRIRIRQPNGLHLFTTVKHLNKINKVKQKYFASTKITAIKPIGDKECTCISVDSADHLFLTEHLIPTHNTVSAIGSMAVAEPKKVCIIVPAPIKYQWERNIKSLLKKHGRIFVCEGQSFDMSEVLRLKHSRIVILNYNIADYWVDLLERFSWDMLILDEAHRIKHPETAVSKAVDKIRDKSKSCLCLSGTPLTDRNSDIWNVVRMVNKNLFPTHFAFQMRYCANEFAPGSNTSRSVNMLELHEKLVSSNTMIRRTKKDVYTQLPKVTTEVIPLGVHSATLDALANEARNESKWMKEQKGRDRGIAAFRVQQSLEKYLQEAIRLKLPLIIDWIKDFLQESDDKLIVGVVHREKCGDILYENFKTMAVHIDGSANAKKKDKLLTEFMTDESKRLLIGNIQSVGTGIDGLQKVCSNMIIVELPWSPADISQLIARLDRNGQTEPVSVSFLVVKDSIDEMLIRMLDRKRKITGEVLDGEAPKTEDTLAYMLNMK